MRILLGCLYGSSVLSRMTSALRSCSLSHASLGDGRPERRGSGVSMPTNTIDVKRGSPLATRSRPADSTSAVLPRPAVPKMT